MTSRERVLCALSGGTPDRVPYCELSIDEAIVCQLLGRALSKDGAYESGEYADNPVDVEKALSRALGRDNIRYILCPPIAAERRVGEGNVLFYCDGWIKSRAGLDRLQLPDPASDRLYKPAREFLAQGEDFALCASCRLGISPTYLSMGQEFFSLALYDEPDLVDEVLYRYTSWSAAVMKQVCAIGFDLVWTADDIAFKNGLLLSPKMFRERILPHVRKVAESITIPWIFHSDGNLAAVLDDLVDLGIRCSRCAHPTSVCRSRASTGTATARGQQRATPAASPYTARAASSVRNVPRNPGGAVMVTTTTSGESGRGSRRGAPAMPRR